jgi:hypothetical protein
MAIAARDGVVAGAIAHADCGSPWLPRSEWTTVPVGSRSATAFDNADTASVAVIRDDIE